MTHHYRIGQAYYGGYAEDVPPDNPDAVPCPVPPHGDALWVDNAWVWPLPDEEDKQMALEV